MKHCIFLMILILNVGFGIQMFSKTNVADFNNYRSAASSFIKQHNLTKEVYGKPYLFFELIHSRGNVVVVVKDSLQYNVFYSAYGHSDSIKRMTLPLTVTKLDSFFSYADTLSKINYIHGDTYHPSNYYIGVWDSSQEKVIEWDSNNLPNDKNAPTNIYIIYWIMFDAHRDKMPIPDGIGTLKFHSLTSIEADGSEAFGVLDDLAFTYQGNRVQSIVNSPDGEDFYGRAAPIINWVAPDSKTDKFQK